jgi:hypothetical protein
MAQETSVKLYSVYYKSFPLHPKASYIVPIQAGAATHTRLPMLGDDSGNHISHLNNYYSELTAAYWIYKNAQRDTTAWGLCHYRRYLIPLVTKYFFKEKSRCYFKTSQVILDRLLTDKLYVYISRLLTTVDVIVQRPTYAKKEGNKVFTIKEGYFADHHREHWEITMEIILEKYPEYAKSISKFGDGKYMFFNNIMITSWTIWDAYLSWLFDIFFQVQQRIDLPKKGYNERVFGFLGERLHNLFIYHNELKPAYLTLGLFEN